MPPYSTAEIQPKYHGAIVAWQKKNFPEIELLSKNWSKYFGSQTPFQLVAKVGDLRSPKIEVGGFAGQEKLQKAGEMEGNMFYTARDIVKAQASTELGSIQQHRLTLDQAQSDAAQYAVLRIMAEELRHAYQMFWVLDNDPTWKKPGHGDVAADTIEELLAMDLYNGTHVLDAFNIEFFTFLDNTVFATVIDLVGKYQLEMQRVFAYAPMAASMNPMLTEEGFHMATGRNNLKELALRAARGEGSYGFAEVQKTLNEWFPRGVEMFGNEAGGQTAMTFGFKDKANGPAQHEYVDEVKGIVAKINAALVQQKLPGTSIEEADALVKRVQETRDAEKGVRFEDLLQVPHKTFFRRRNIDAMYQPYDVSGNLLKEQGKPYSPERYVSYLKTVLPDPYTGSKEFGRYGETLKAYHAQESGPAEARTW